MRKTTCTDQVTLKELAYITEKCADNEGFCFCQVTGQASAIYVCMLRFILPEEKNVVSTTVHIGFMLSPISLQTLVQLPAQLTMLEIHGYY